MVFWLITCRLLRVITLITQNSKMQDGKLEIRETIQVIVVMSVIS